jgi:serine/threonine protein kinase
MAKSSPRDAASPLAEGDRVDRACDEFEAALVRGENPQIDDWLVAEQGNPIRLLQELIAIEFDRFAHSGKSPTADAYFERFPQLLAHPDAAIRLVEREFRAAQSKTPGPSLADFTRRYPQLAKLPAWEEGLWFATKTHDHTPHGIDPSALHRSVTDAGNPPFGPPLADGDIGSLGPYRIRRELGRGGMGAVYLARDTRLNRSVALKVMLPRFAAHAEAKKRFIREARTAAAISNDHIVTIHEADECDGVPFIAMQYLQGRTLDAFMKETRTIEFPEVLRIGIETARGLAAAHSVGLIHRDIKPGNLWLEEPRARVKILDFGLAKPVDDNAEEGSDLTESGAIVGTPAYMAPEQARGESTDHRSDLFSLGVVLYRLSTGKSPFAGKGKMGVLAAVMVDRPTPVASLRPEIPVAFSQLIDALLAKDPTSRPASALQVAQTLQRILGSQTGIDPLPSKAYPVVADAGKGELFADIDSTEKLERTVTNRPVKTSFNRLVAAATLACVGIISVLGIVLVTGKSKGILSVDSDDPGMAIVVRREGQIVGEPTTLRLIDLPVGRYTVEPAPASSGSVTWTLQPDTIDIVRNRTTTVTVRRIVPRMVGKTPVIEKTTIAPPPKTTPLGPIAEDARPGLHFNGRSTLVVVPTTHFDGTLPLTFEAWVTPGEVLNLSRHVCLMGPKSGGIGLSNNGSFGAGLHVGTGWVSTYSSQRLLTGTRYHLAAVFQADGIRLFVDGKESSRKEVKLAGYSPSKAPMRLGNHYPDEPEGPFHGTMHAIRISKSVRYATGFVPPAKFEVDRETIHLFDMAEATGTRLTDRADGKTVGEIVDGEWRMAKPK